MTPKLKWSAMSEDERNALVAEKVMDWKHDPIIGRDVPTRYDWFDGKSIRDISPFSTSIHAAFEVVSRMRELDKDCRCSITEYNEEWRCSFGKHHAYAKSLPEAICLAALRAVGVEVDL